LHGGGARGFFTPGQPVRGSSAAFTRDQATRTLRYTGSAGAPAWLQQGEDSRIEAHAIALNEETGDLTATGQVRSDVQMEASPVGRGTSVGSAGREPSTAPARYLITAETMQYVEKPRTATYGGAPAVLQRLDGEKFEIRAKAVAQTLASGERRLERLEATGEMRATLDGGREAVGDQLTYRAAADRYTIRGRPVLVRFRQDDGTCSLSRGQLVHFVGGDRGHEWPLSDNPGGTASGAHSCTGPLR
jgi:lipopolysaccharide export system protein LptA